MTQKRLNPVQAIRKKCLDCCGFQSKEVKLCVSVNCPLWRYRMGKEERDDLYEKNKTDNQKRKEKYEAQKKKESK